MARVTIQPLMGSQQSRHRQEFSGAQTMVNYMGETCHAKYSSGTSPQGMPGEYTGQEPSRGSFSSYPGGTGVRIKNRNERLQRNANVRREVRTRLQVLDDATPCGGYEHCMRF